MKFKSSPLLRSVLFLGLLLAFLLGGSRIFIPKDNRTESGMDLVTANGILGERDNSIDVLIVGDSESYSSFSPMQMWEDHGFTAYVCGTPAQPLYDSYRFMEQAFERQSPSLVILETNAIFREKTTGSYISSMMSSRFPLFQYHNRWKSMSLKDLYRSVKYTWTDDYKGYIYETQVSPADISNYMDPSDDVAVIPELNQLCLDKMIALCEANNAQLILVSTPSPRNWNYDRHNAIAAYAQKNELTYLDMNLHHEEIGIDWEKDTRDKGDHLNFSGAKKASDYLGDYLMARFSLPDHRSDADYRSWADAYRRYSKSVQA